MTHNRSRKNKPAQLLLTAVFLTILPAAFTGTGCSAQSAANNKYLPVYAVQGEGHVSPYEGKEVSNVQGVVTAVHGKGFWIESIQPDGNPATSEGLYVYTESKPEVQPGWLLVLSGTVEEFGYKDNLRVTQLSSPKIIRVLNKNTALPPAVRVGPGALMPPSAHICTDGSITAESRFNPETDGIDFWESLEGMRLSIEDPVVVGCGKYGETALLPNRGQAADGTPFPARTERGGISISPGRFNPQIILLDSDAPILHLPAMKAPAGSTFAGPVQGILSYSYGNYVLLPIKEPQLIPGSLEREQSSIKPERNRLTVATFNLEDYPKSSKNMSRRKTEKKTADLARTIAKALNSPDILVLQEVCDNSFSEDDGVVEADANIQKLIQAIHAAGGPESYKSVQINPENNKDGGWRGANIRTVFLYNSRRVQFAAPSGGLKNPQLITGKAFTKSRKPLTGRFIFNGQDIFVVGVHLVSKGSDSSLWGTRQPPLFKSAEKRLEQAKAVQGYVGRLLSGKPDAAVIVAGDFNDFAFSAPLQLLQRNSLYNLSAELLPLSEQYTYNYDGNGQQLDHILVSKNLFTASPQVDIVHRYSEYPAASRHTDHDPVLAGFEIPY